MSAPVTKLNTIVDGWFREHEAMWPGQRMCLKVDEVLFEERSEFQDVLVFKSSTYGTVLVLDGVIQLTERDEFAYQEMIVHLPMFSHPNPRKVLIVGAGDGGVLREVTRHEGVEEIVMCEIDKMVVDVSKKYLSNSTAVAFDDPRLTLLFDDAAKYMAANPGKFDVIIVDSSDPVGPAASLFTPAWFKNLGAALAPGGFISTQGECQWLHLDLIQSTMKSCGSLFPIVDYGYTTIPTYPSGQIGFLLLSNDPEATPSVPKRQPTAALESVLRYYSPSIHSAAFVLPKFTERAVGPVRKTARAAVKAAPCVSISKCGGLGAVVGAFALGAFVAGVCFCRR